MPLIRYNYILSRSEITSIIIMTFNQWRQSILIVPDRLYHERSMHIQNVKTITTKKHYSHNVIEPRLFNSLPPGRRGCNLYMSNFQTHIKDKYLEHFLWNSNHVNATRPQWWLVDNASGNGDTDLGQHWLRQWLVAWRHQALNQCWLIINGHIGI